MNDIINVVSSKRVELIDITEKVKRYIEKCSIKDGLCCLYVPHTTSAIMINEGADPAVAQDIIEYLDKSVPYRDNYLHAEGNSDAHIKSVLVGSSISVLIEDGRPLLGTWQSIFFCEFDGPRKRRVHIKLLG